jgi:hypothetical protein
MAGFPGRSPWPPVLAENAHPFENPPLGMNIRFGLFGLTR